MTGLAIAQTTKRAAPGPRVWPVIGNVGALRGFLPFLEQQWAQQGDVFRIKLMGLSAVLVAHPDHLQHVLMTKRQNYVKGNVYKGLRRFIGDGLLTLDGQAWKERRALAQPAFHRQALEKLTAIMVESGARFFDGIRDQLTQGSIVVDVHEQMVRLTLDVVINALFGRGTLESGRISYDALGDTFELISAGINGVQLPAWIPTPGNLKFQRTLRALDENVYHIIETARRNPTEGTLLSMLLAARDEHGQPLNDVELRNEVLTLFIAGHETTALTLTWMFALLDGQPEVFACMRDEVDTVLNAREPTFADVPKLDYCAA